VVQNERGRIEEMEGQRRTHCGEGAEESGGLFAVVTDTGPVCTNTCVARCCEEGDASGTELGKSRTSSSRVGFWHALLIVAKRCTDYVWEVLLVEHIIKPDEIGLIRVSRCGGARKEGRRAASYLPHGQGYWPSHSKNGLGVHDSF
jgi:hypothetical protein